MSEQTYSPEEIKALRDTIKIVRSTGPSPEVLAVVERVERELEEQRTRHPSRKRPAKRTTHRPQAAAG